MSWRRCWRGTRAFPSLTSRRPASTFWSFNNLIEVFQDLQKTLNGSMVIISHQERILAIADEIVVIAGGRVTAQGPAQEIMGKLLSGEKSCDSCPKQEVLYGGECHE